MTRLILLTGFLTFAVGCGGGLPQTEIDRAQQAVVASLDGWKANDPPAKLKTLPDPVDFTEELRGTHSLTDYTLGKVDASDKEVVRVAVTLSLKDKKGKASQREAVFSVSLKTPVVVARDPYY